MTGTRKHQPTDYLQIALGVLLRYSKTIISYTFDFGFTCNHDKFRRFKKSAVEPASHKITMGGTSYRTWLGENNCWQLLCRHPFAKMASCQHSLSGNNFLPNHQLVSNTGMTFNPMIQAWVSTDDECRCNCTCQKKSPRPEWPMMMMTSLHDKMCPVISQRN